MSGLWRFLLDIERIPADASWSALQWGWERAFPGWFWGMVLFLGALFAVWSYSGLVGNRRWRGVLAGVRFGFLLILLIVIAGPNLVFPREHLERDWVMMLVDRSESMTVADVDGGGGGVRVSRDAQLSALLDGYGGAGGGLAELNAAHEVAWMGFDGTAFDLEMVEGASGGEEEEEGGEEAVRVPRLGGATGGQTMIGPAIGEALRRSAARPVSGVVIFSDGRTTRGPDREILRRLSADGIPIFVVPLGSAEAMGDVVIREVRAPQRAFVHDKTPVEVTLDHLGSVLERSGVEVLLIDERTGEVLAQERIEAGSDVEKVLLTATPSVAGAGEWLVRIEPDIPDLIAENNSKTVAIDLVDRPIHVLYVDGYPRWDYRYMKGLQVREGTIDGSVILLSADRDFAQEGNTAITRLPNSPEELDPYDVIVIGDVHAEFFSPRQLEMIYDHVSERGAGLLWMAGPRSNPQTFVGTPLASLLPMRTGGTGGGGVGGGSGFGSIGMPVTMTATEAARRLGILNLIDQDGEDAWDVLANPGNQWNQLQWALRIDPADLKPTAEVLAETVEGFSSAGGGLPLVVQMRFGSGQSLFVGTDEIWRWRYGRGERLPEQFWIQMIRMLGRDRLSISGRSATLAVNPRRVEVGEPAVLELRLFDEQLVERGLTSIPVEILDEEGRRVGEVTLRSVEGAAGQYAGTYRAVGTGELRVRPLEAPFDRMEEMEARLDVYLADDEMQQPESDHEFLAGLAAETGGAVIAVGDVETELARMLPNRAVRTQMDVVESIWDTPLVLVIFFLLLTGEWVGRKMNRLV